MLDHGQRRLRPAQPADRRAARRRPDRHRSAADPPAALRRRRCSPVGSSSRSAAGTARHDRARGADELPEYLVDPDKFTQVVTNLVENAVRHGEGEVARDRRARPGRRRRTSRSTVTTRATASRRRCGSGCSPSSGPAEPRGGSGLGLYIVNGLVRAHGGTVTIDDAPGGGRPGDHHAGRSTARNRVTPADRAAVPRLASRVRTQHRLTTPWRSRRCSPRRSRPRATPPSPRSRPPATWTSSSGSGSSTPATGRRWRSPTARSARCRRRPARRPASGSARPAARSTRRSPRAQAVLEAEHEERMLVEETVDVTLPDRPVAARRPAPASPPAPS